MVLTSLDAWMLERYYIYEENKTFKSDFFVSIHVFLMKYIDDLH
jgi:hypothetical protein